MGDWTSGYVVDVAYTHGFYRELAPSFLDYLCLLHGVEPPVRGLGKRTYCELGCGQGLTANVLAAANPHMQVYATDFNPGHISGASTLAQAGRLRNAHFFDDSFEEFLERTDLPDFDYIALHGIYSWISVENRGAIVRFIRRKLRPGGAVYISYNTMPGWSALMPFRRLLLEHTSHHGGHTADGIQAALDFAGRLGETDAAYFQQHPKVGARLDELKGMDKGYIAHEYLNRDHHPFFFSDVARELAEAKLSWVGSASAVDTSDELHLTAEQQKVLSEIGNVEFRQTVRDHLVNQSFRKDIFIKGPVRLPLPAVNDAMTELAFTLAAKSEDVPSRIDGGKSAVNIGPELHAAITETFSGGPRTLGEAQSHPGLSKISPRELVRALNYLVGHGSCHPCLPSEGLAERLAHAHEFNRAVAETSRHDTKIGCFASGVSGNGFPIERVRQLFWLARQDAHADPAQFVSATLGKAGHRLLKEGKALPPGPETETHLREIYADWLDNGGTALRNLGIDATLWMPEMTSERRLIA